MLLDITGNLHVLFVGGKGGTGKTSISSGLAMAHANEGRRVLLVSTDPAHNLGDIWDTPLSDSPRRVFTAESDRAEANAGGVDAVEVDPETTINDHFATVETMMRRMLPERTHRAAHDHLKLAKTAPGSHESAILERVATIAEDARGTYDLVIFDTAPTGHTLHLLSLPERLSGWAESLLANRDRSERFAAAARSLVSPKEETPSPDMALRQNLLARRDRFSQLRETIADPEQTGFIVTTLAEKLPVAETLGLIRELKSLGVNLAGVVVNRRSPSDAGTFLSDRRQLEDTHLPRLEQAVAPVPLMQLPLLPGELSGSTGISELAKLLAIR